MYEIALNPPHSSVQVQVRKFDGSLHRCWGATLFSMEGSLLILDARFEEEVQHPLMGLIERGTLSLEYYWLDRWYNVFRFLTPQGELRNYYCNVNVPPAFDGRILSYVDLDIDILVEPDLSYKVLDEDEFEENAARYRYTQQVKDEAKRAVAQLIELIEARRFPFRD